MQTWKSKDLIGMSFYKWTVLKKAESSKSGKVRWICRCKCGTEKVLCGSSLKAGTTKGCMACCTRKGIENPKNKKDRTGETRQMTNGVKAKIIAYRNHNSIDVQFENGAIAYKKTYTNFAKGNIKCPMIYETNGDITTVTNANTNPITKFIIDTEDIPLLQDSFWFNRLGYVSRSGSANHKEKFVHRHIMKPPQGMVIDHANGDSMDNRKSNLRICTQEENSRNQKISKNNGTGYKGVTCRYVATIGVGGKRKNLGSYDTAKEAAEAYNKAAIKYFGEFAKLNEI